MTFPELYQRYRKCEPPKRKMLALDPGNMCGCAIFQGVELLDWMQVPFVEDNNGIILFDNIHKLLEEVKPERLVVEDYLVYEQKLQQHTFSRVPTIQIIGAIKYWAYLNGIPIQLYKAQTHKTFCTDAKLKEWGYWKPGMRHSRDAIRIGCYDTLFYKGA